jgi:phage internal scaffolding protein
MIRTKYNYDATLVSFTTGTSCPEPTLAQQHMKDECDINQIILKMTRGNPIPVNTSQATYGDFSNAEEYQTLMNRLIDAQASFDELPATLRERFANNPANLIDFLAKKSNKDEAIKLGLINPPQVLDSVEKTE